MPSSLALPARTNYAKLGGEWASHGPGDGQSVVEGVDLVIKGFKKLQQTQLHRATKLVIVGDGPDRSRLESLASDCSRM